MAVSKPPRPAPTLSEEQVQLIAGALADPRRYQILKRLREYEKALDCTTVGDCVEISPATVSDHMKELEQAGLVTAQRKGKFVSYLLRREVLDAFMRRVKSDLA